MGRHTLKILQQMGVLLSFSIKKIFYDKMDLRLFYFRVTNYVRSLSSSNTENKNSEFDSVHDLGNG